MGFKKSDECEGCVYWRGLSPTNASEGKCCHHLLDTGKRRERFGDMCLSKKEGKYKRGPHPFDVPIAQQ